MQIAVSTKEALEKLESMSVLAKKPGFIFPSFVIEIGFIELYIHMLKDAPDQDNIIPYMNAFIDRSLEESVADIFNVQQIHVRLTHL